MLKDGLYEELINSKLNDELDRLHSIKDIKRNKIDLEESKNILSKYISEVIKKGLNYIREDTKNNKDEEIILKQIKACNHIIDNLSNIANEDSLKEYNISEKAEILMSLYSKINSARSVNDKLKIIRPTTSISESSLFTGSQIEPSMISEIKKEIVTCDSIDMLVSFIKWSGLRLILDDLKEFVKKSDNKIRIITTSYMGATDYKAVEELSKIPNVKVKVSYDTKRTRLHAKAYLFKRETGFTTAYIGSSNLSNPAMTNGLEWNIKVSEKDSLHIVKKFNATFESYWNDNEFVLFNGEDEKDKNILKEALNNSFTKENDFNFNLDIHPYYYQKEILERLEAERTLFGRHKNLLVAATGVGKTVISAFDYKRFMKSNPKNNRLLFVAHREEILKQSRDTFRAILKDSNFGSLHVGSYKLDSLEYLFMSIQSFNSTKLYEKITPDYYDFIIVDEFHHAAANSYEKLLKYFKPKELLGLTATPDRMDGKSIYEYFDDKIAAEMRLTEAIDKKLLCPFQYFGVTDEVDLSKVKWKRGGYDKSELSNLYTENHIRVIQIINSLNKYVNSIEEVKGLGFCVSVEHAKFMAHVFNKKGIKSICLHGQSNKEERESAKDKITKGEIKFIFVADLYNEGIDIPPINTVLLLRPTESLTIFLQQLGRGLRNYEGKECLTVLDFVGQSHKNYNFEEKFRALIGKTKYSIKYSIENEFIHLPKGCYIKLEKQAKEYILRNISQARNTKNNLLIKMRTFANDTDMKLTLENFLNYYQMELIDFYSSSVNRSFYHIKSIIEDREFQINKEQEKTIKRFKNLFYINSRRFIKFSIDLIMNIEKVSIMDLTKEQKILLNILYYSFYSNNPFKEGLTCSLEGLKKIFNEEYIKDEVIDILNHNYNKICFVDERVDLGFASGLDLHCTYTKDQILSGLDYYNEKQSPAMREGVKYIADKKLDVFFITLNKSDKDFSPSTLYDDYAINEILFHWQSQSRTTVQSPTGQRYINHKEKNSKIVLFVREYKNKNGITSPYTYLGKASYVRHYGDRPISFEWKLEKQMPANMISSANKSIV
ncbi:MAG: DUF3427 domain-containing protein [Anaeromicrobium sp.]|jgi:superfamily II DNA or RNA helicase|uniref:DEAD/DEAH box helicase n=1 Tax=Anaeromicrobium sp. TaxID=1929132 RepID=UPI0025FB8896|nr:DEAD/DEAH box helicase [Anaeromicrobium sp.]MCT4592982.1 DUF3427 domain-containing protein [Anaeromicrobium sp.]